MGRKLSLKLRFFCFGSHLREREREREQERWRVDCVWIRKRVRVGDYMEGRGGGGGGVGGWW